MFRYDPSHDYRQEAWEYWNKNVKSIRNKLIIFGIILLLLGVLCLFKPIQAVTFISYIVTIGLIVIGIVQIVDYSRIPVYFRFGGGILSGVLNILLGVMLLFSSRESMVLTISFCFAFDLLVVGINELSIANRASIFGATNTGWLTFEGIVNIIASVVFFFLPNYGAITISIIAGIYLITAGIMLLIAASNINRLKFEGFNDMNPSSSDDPNVIYSDEVNGSK